MGGWGGFFFVPIAFPEFNPKLNANRLIVKATASTDYPWIVLSGREYLEKTHKDNGEFVDFRGIKLVGKSVEKELGINPIARLHYQLLVEGKVIGFSDQYKSISNKLIPIFQVTEWVPAEYIPRLEKVLGPTSIFLFFSPILLLPIVIFLYFKRRKTTPNNALHRATR